MNKGIMSRRLSDDPHMPILETGLDFNTLVFPFSYYQCCNSNVGLFFQLRCRIFTGKEGNLLLMAQYHSRVEVTIQWI